MGLLFPVNITGLSIQHGCGGLAGRGIKAICLSLKLPEEAVCMIKLLFGKNITFFVSL